MLNGVSPVLLDVPDVMDACDCGLPRPDLAGCRVRVRGTTPIYLIDSEGYRRLVPFPLTFMNLFQDSTLLEVLVSGAVAEMPEGPPLDNGAVLLRGNCCERIYLLDQGKKRLITSQRVMEKYGFNEEAVVVVPKIVVAAVPDGEIWE